MSLIPPRRQAVDLAEFRHRWGLDFRLAVPFSLIANGARRGCGQASVGTAPRAAPITGIRKIVPISRPQNPPDRAPAAVVLNNWLSLTAPSADLTAITASPSSIRYSFWSSKIRLRTDSACSSVE